MTQPIGYWCPVCGDLERKESLFGPPMYLHAFRCDGDAIPVFKPLDVPEVTTWGESGGADAEWWSGFMSPEEATDVIKSLKVKP